MNDFSGGGGVFDYYSRAGLIRSSDEVLVATREPMRRKWRMKMRWRYSDCIQPHGLKLAAKRARAPIACMTLISHRTEGRIGIMGSFRFHVSKP